jgi:hypothetical protein
MGHILTADPAIAHAWRKKIPPTPPDFKNAIRVANIE